MCALNFLADFFCFIVYTNLIYIYIYGLNDLKFPRRILPKTHENYNMFADFRNFIE